MGAIPGRESQCLVHYSFSLFPARNPHISALIAFEYYLFLVIGVISRRIDFSFLLPAFFFSFFFVYREAGKLDTWGKTTFRNGLTYFSYLVFSRFDYDELRPLPRMTNCKVAANEAFTTPFSCNAS